MEPLAGREPYYSLLASVAEPQDLQEVGGEHSLLKGQHLYY
jgi:hypothetical protein